MENSYNEIEYIKKKNKKYEIITDNIIDYSIYDSYIPLCLVCNTTYKKYINSNQESSKIHSPHCIVNCFWWDYFKEKLLIIDKHLMFYPTSDLDNHAYGSIVDKKDDKKNDKKDDKKNDKKDKKKKK